MEDKPAEKVLLSGALRRCAGEIDHIAVMTTQVEEMLFSWAKEVAPLANAPSAFHQLDLLVQMAEEMANFLTDLANEMPGDQYVELNQILKRIRLATLRKSLSEDANDDVLTKSKNTNEIEFF